MSTVFSQVAAAIVTSLQAATAVSANIYRARVKAAAAEWTNMVVVRVMDSQLERFAIKGGPFNLDTTIAIECYARGGPGTRPGPSSRSRCAPKPRRSACRCASAASRACRARS